MRAVPNTLRTPVPPTAPYTVYQEHEFEPQHGLPAPLPRGEALLWQGSPDAHALFRRACHGYKVAAYFALLVVWEVASGVADGLPAARVAASAASLLPLAALALGLLALFAWLSARTTVYTLTSRRIVMRIGIVLTVSYNLPLVRIDAALRQGDAIALELERGTRIAWLHLWPHARPWHLRRPQPMLRGLADAQALSRLLAETWAAANPGAAPAGQAGAVVSATPVASAAQPARSTASPTLASRAAPAALALLPACVAAHLPVAAGMWTPL